jgi:hypothetical protein
VLRLLAQQLSFEVVEWATPTPTLWTEHSYQVGLGRQPGAVQAVQLLALASGPGANRL